MHVGFNGELGEGKHDTRKDVDNDLIEKLANAWEGQVGTFNLV